MIEDALPLAIQAGNQLACSNKENIMLDKADIENNIDKAEVDGNLSPKQIDIIKKNQGITKKKNKVVKASAMQKRNFLKNKLN